MAYDFSNLTVLVVEDNAPMADLIQSLLTTFGVQRVLNARHGKEAFDIYLKHAPDLILTDWMMEEMDGVSLTKQIRTSTRSSNPFVPIIMMTGFSEKRRVIQARDAGITEFLVKPFTARDLYRRLEEIIEHPRQFVNAENFFGPDRRRRGDPSYNGPQRRDNPNQRNLDGITLFGEDQSS